MDFESSHEAASRLHVNVRTIQKWAKEGKLPGAKRMGKTWMIPTHVTGPSVVQQSDVLLMPLLNSCFASGTCLEQIEALNDEVEKDIAYGEYYYFSGQPGKAVEIIEKYLYHTDLSIALSANAIYIFASMSLGEFGQKFHSMQNKLKDINQNMINVMNDRNAGYFRLPSILFQNAAAVLMHIPIPSKNDLQKELMQLPEGLRLFGAYTIAHNLYLHQEYERALGVSETALAMINGSYPIARIYLMLMEATALLNLRRTEEAKHVFMDAWNLAKKDGFIEPFAEHYALLHGLAESCLKRTDTAGFQQIITATRRFKKGWIVYHEKATQKVIVDNLTTTEFSIAMMYTKAWSIKEIAAHLDLSERMVKHHIAMIYEKLDVSSRDELSEYLPK